ncbi:MAG: glycoside hydrolase family 55 protein [Clostridia bacterium]|nr:glycoside hydrolase family 55 protein [Clostridia bacterium]
MYSFGINVFDFGAKGDGVTDDTAAIQAAIDYTASRGGGKILFPYTKGGYRVASPAASEIDGKPVRAQLIIPAGDANIQLEGEMPCKLLYSYQVRPMEAVKDNFEPTRFGDMSCNNTRIFSDWEAPEEHDPTARPWAIIAAPEGNSCKGHFSASQFSIANLEFRVKLNTDKMYPTQTAVNLQNVSRINVSDCQFCLGEQVGDTLLGKELQPNPCHTAGLIASGDQNDNNVIRNSAAQGFRYGFVLGEHVVADYLYVHNCEEGITFHDCSHLSVINHVVAQHNTVILSTTAADLFGMPKGPCYVSVGSVNFECGAGLLPAVSRLKYGVFDPESRLRGTLCWHKPWGKKEFPAVCGERFEITKF